MHDLDDLEASSQLFKGPDEPETVDVSEYDFGDAPSFIEDEQLELRDEVVLEDSSRYLGEWIIGTDTR